MDIDLDNRFDYHPPNTDTRTIHEHIRGLFKTLSEQAVALTPSGREQSLMVTHLEESLFWANAAIARKVES
jgi:hypothetical protein